MGFFPRPSRPSDAWADLRAFLQAGGSHKLGFAALSIVIPAFFLLLFTLDTVEKEYVAPEITWVTTFDPNRSDAEIIAQQKIDTAERIKREKELAIEMERRRKPFKDAEAAMKRWGL